jgi:excinuclease ABC subunit C
VSAVTHPELLHSVPSTTPLRERIRASAENRPGVYRWLGSDDQVLYVGKSIRVRSRLLSYFRAERGEKMANLVRDARRVDWEYVPNEFGALLREMRLIQHHRPRYNVQHKRKRAYAFVKLTREPAGRVLPVTRVADDGAVYFGPFPKVGQVGEAVRDLVYALGLRDCPATTPIVFGDQLDLFGGVSQVPGCIRADLGTCSAPCCGRVEVVDYQARVRQARGYLEGKGRAPLESIRHGMARAAANQEFEYAAVLRDRLERLERFQAQLAAFRGRVESLTFLYRVAGYRGADRIYLVRRGRVRDEMPRPTSARGRMHIAARVQELLSEPETGPGGLTGREAAEILFVARWFEIRPRQLKFTEAPDEWLERQRRGHLQGHPEVTSRPSA